MGSNGSGEDKPRGSGSLEDTVPASEPPLDIHGQPMRSSRASIPPIAHERYRHGTELGRGGMGRVVEAFDTQLGRTVALKEVLPKGPSVARRFIREIQITARLEHASIVPLYDSGTTPDGRPFYVMRRVSGSPLDTLIKRARDLGERLTLLPAMLAAIDAVAHAHKRGIIHRDLKPANILVGEYGETVVIDWGLAKVIGEEEETDGIEPTIPDAADSLQTQIGSVFGTPGFMAPEQARGETLSTRGDVYALGATLYHLLAGTPPHGGDSATAVLGSTLKHDVVPLEESAPGAPPELVAIVDKALAFELEDRYPNAGALGEDVRRFLAGQLVAAHRYTPRQRIARFAKRHRTALAVAALATVAVAALAWFSVHRIVEERDAATSARHAALADKRAAEAARDSLADRNDALLLTQARALLDTNPTEALAVLKQLPASSSRLPEARAIGQAAVTRGVWWAMQGPDQYTTRIEISPDGRQLLTISRDNILRIWDLERRRLVIARPYSENFVGSWVSGGRVLVWGSRLVPEVLDPAANQSTALGLELLGSVEITATGDRMIATDANKLPFVFDLATGSRMPLWNGRAADSIAISPDGKWSVVADSKGAVAFDASGKELVRVDGYIVRISTSRFGVFAVATMTKVVECKLAPAPVCSELAYPVVPPPRIIDMTYRDRELMMFTGSSDVYGWSGVTMDLRTRVDQFMPRMSEVGNGVVIIPTHTGKLRLLGVYLDTSLTLPVPVSHARVASRASHSRIAVVGDGQILVVDLGPVLPRLVPDTAKVAASFIDDDTLIVTNVMEFKWARIHLDTGKRDTLAMRGVGVPAVYDVEGGRALVAEELGNDSKLIALERGDKLRKLATGPDLWGRLIPGDAVIFGFASVRPDGSIKSDGRVLAAIGDAEPREVVKLDGDASWSVGLGRLRYAVLSTKGELVRGNLDDGTIERTNIVLGDRQMLASEPGGRVLIAAGDRLLVWDRDVYEVARFEKPIRMIAAGDRGRIIVILDNNDVMEVAMRPGATPSRLVSGGQDLGATSRDGKMIAVPGNGQQVTIVELGGDVATRWTLPARFSSARLVGISPSMRRILLYAHHGMLIWDLPSTTPDFRGWLDEQSNATKVGDEVLAWPWQVRKP